MNIDAKKATTMQYRKLRLMGLLVMLSFGLMPLVGGLSMYSSTGSPVATVSAATVNPPAPTNTINCPRGECIINKYVNPIIAVLSALVGVAVAISIVVGSIQYASASNDPQKIAAAKSRITTAVLVLLGSFFLYAFLNYLIPGGLL